MNDSALRQALHRAGYIADEALATTLWLTGWSSGCESGSRGAGSTQRAGVDLVAWF